ncbi:hypothetical protein roselon_02338 [Roseibacterium elongatum DSM 19469]|uniref:TPR domain protein n=1 Tax=Roseicyclus elongatus DSM 19469 TaxID=1294273 RepID=W8RTZ0_9RHOB|nr:hypothetical protein [Roseibacterium elongatum]AHM04673.1 hypothetical protein roselon_02338 [Roseibacterium elongatum DSM 19469]
MTERAKADSQSDVAQAAFDSGDAGLARKMAEAGLKRHPEDRALLRLLLRAQLRVQDKGAARSTEEKLAEDHLDSDTLSLLIDTALTDDRSGDARAIVARAMSEGQIGGADIAAARARIAFHDGDVEAAKAILVMAIEAHPEAPGLRPMLTETLMVSGGAAYARDVQKNLGKEPVNPAPQDAETTPPDDQTPETTAKGA